MRVAVVAIAVAACSNEPSRLDGLTARRAPVVRTPDGAPPDEADQDLRRKLREVAARPVDQAAIALAPGVLGRQPRPFGPLAGLRPEMTRADIVAAIPETQADGALLWVPTGIAGVTVELSFDGTDRLREVVYQLPLAARPMLVEAWGPPVPQAETWFDREHGWRAKLVEDAITGKVVVAIAGYTPFAALLGSGPDGLAEPAPMIGATLRELRARFGSRVIAASTMHGFVEIAMPRATDVCATATELGLELDGAGTVVRAMVLQCYDDLDVNRRAALAAMERQWGPGTPTRTGDDRLVFAWSLPGRRIEARQVQHAKQALWEISIRAAR